MRFQYLPPLALLLAGTACTPVRPGNPPQAPIVITGEVNARVVPPLPGQPNTVVAFGAIPWQSAPRPRPAGDVSEWENTHTWGWRNDVLVESRNALQIQIGHRLGTDSLEVRDGQGNRLPFQSARQHSSFPCVAATDTTPATGECWPAPQDPRYRAPPTLPDNQMHVSYEVVNACDGVPTPALLNPQPDRSRVCVPGQAADSAIILTISPPTNGQPLTHGQTFDVQLVAFQGSGSSPVEAVTPLKLVHVVPGNCRVQITATPAFPHAAGSNVQLNWTSTGCARLVQTVNGQVLGEDRVDPTGGVAFAPLNGSRAVTANARAERYEVQGTDALAFRTGDSIAWAWVGPRSPPGGFYAVGTSGTGRGSSPAPGGPCAGGASQSSFSFTRTCSAGGTSSSTNLGGEGCSRGEALQKLQAIYAIELSQGCVIR